MIVDWTVRAGDLISFAGFVIGGLSVIFMMKSDIRQLALRLGFLADTVDGQKERIDRQSQEISRIAELIVVMGRFEERFAAMHREQERQKTELDGLRRGEGWIVAPKRG